MMNRDTMVMNMYVEDGNHGDECMNAERNNGDKEKDWWWICVMKKETIVMNMYMMKKETMVMNMYMMKKNNSDEYVYDEASNPGDYY